MVIDETKRFQKAARKLIIAAWVIEIIAASVGLFFAVSRLIPSLDGSTMATVLGLQGALPFFAVAIVELTKIPLAFVCYQTTQVGWKIIFGFSLAAAMFITFETFFMGFESYQSHLTKELRPTLDEIKNLERRIENSRSVKNSANEFLVDRTEADDRHQQTIRGINNQLELLIQPFIERRQEIRDKYSLDIAPLQARLVRRSGDLEALDNEYGEQRQSLIDQFSAELTVASDTSESQIGFIRSDLLLAEERLQGLFKEDATARTIFRAEYLKERKEAGFFGANRVDINYKIEMEEYDLKFNERREILEGDIRAHKIKLEPTSNFRSEINAQRDDALRALEDRFNERRAEITASIDGLQTDISKAQQAELSLADSSAVAELDAKIEEERERSLGLINNENNSYEEQKSIFSSQSSRVSTASSAIEDAEALLGPECSTLNEKVIDNQVYRFAMQAFAVDDACKLTEPQLSLIKVVWFGSLALIVSALGTILGFASFVISGDKPRIIIKEVPVDKIVEKEVIKEVLVEKNVIVEVIKEVPVDKVVFRDVPVEVVRKEVVHIPVYTEDKSLLGKQSKSDDKK
jgi:hypothetical protein